MIYQRYLVGISLKSRIIASNIIDCDQVKILFLQFSFSFIQKIGAFGGKTDQKLLCAVFSFTQFLEDIRICRQPQ